MTKAPEYGGVASVFRSGRSHAVLLSAASRFETAEVEVVEEGDRLAQRPRGKEWSAFFDSGTRGSLPQRRQPSLDERDGRR